VTGAVSPVVAALVAVLVVLGAALALLGSFGLLRLPTFYQRVHPPTMGTTLGVAFTVAASILLLSAIESRLSLEAILVAVFAIVTTPVTFMLLMRAAVHRDPACREEGVE
jgi:multicomponent K+:H+ antiporter subunit G